MRGRKARWRNQSKRKGKEKVIQREEMKRKVGEENIRSVEEAEGKKDEINRKDEHIMTKDEK